MATAKASAKRSGAFSDWKLGLIVGLSMCIMGALAWRYAGQAETGSTQRPVPVWLGVSKLTSQLENGQMLAFKVGLQVKQKDDLEVLTPHVPALETMIRELGQGVSKEDLASPDGITEFGQDIRRSVNNYLRKQKVEPRVLTVAFEDIFLTP
jgi:flagellar basal body-associated protein FliL